MSNAEIGSMLNEALQLCEAGELAQAAQVCRRVLAHDADVPDAWNMLAAVLYQQGQLDEAAEATQRATLMRPAIAPYWLTRGNIAMARDRNPEAQSSFVRALELDPGFAEAHYRLALSHHRDDRMADAIAGYRRALQIAPDVAEIHFQLAEALASEARCDEAIAAYQEAFARDPQGVFDRRGAFDCLWYLKWNALPQLWFEELARFLARDDIDRDRYIKVTLRALKATPPFRVLLGAAGQPAVPLAAGSIALRDAMRDGLFQLLLRDALIVDAALETLLTRLRAALLTDSGLRAQAPQDFLWALALQCFNNEFVFAVADAEAERVSALRGEVASGAVPGGREQAMLAVAVLAMYAPLDPLLLPLIETPLASPTAALLVRRSVTNRATENELRSHIPALGEITDDVSRAVRDMYEEHPYPRWFSFDRGVPVTLSEWVRHFLPALKTPVEFPVDARILVAGCGTGKEAIALATTMPGARVLALDLSLTSLAYAQRMANEHGIGNIEFLRADILGLRALTERFDMIACSGVLHHMREPRAGLSVLVSLLRPGGLMRLSLYSERARVSVTAAREIIRQQGIPPTTTAIREFRQFVLRNADDGPLHGLRAITDFYSTSMCRDLLFHVQEHQFGLPQVAALLRAHGLSVLSLLQGVPQPALLDYRRMFPLDETMADLDNWDAFETRYPQTFIGMYNLLCRLEDQ